MGPTLATQVILGSRLRDESELIHLDTSDHRGIETLGAIDFWNIYLPLKCYVLLIWMILRHRPQVVYVPISQATIGYLKDSGFILIAKVLRRQVRVVACIEDPLVIGKILAHLETQPPVLAGAGRRPEVRGPPPGRLVLG